MNQLARHSARLPFGFWLALGCAGLFVAVMAVIAALVASGVVRS